MKKTVEVEKVKHFVSDQNGRINLEVDPVQRLMLKGGSWTAETLLQYNSAISKFMKYGKDKGLGKNQLLPATAEHIRLFIAWAGEKVEGEEKTNQEIRPSTIEAYLSGLRAWHLFHHVKFPDIEQKEINLCIKALKLLDARNDQRPQKNPVQIKHLVSLLRHMKRNDDADEMVVTVALVAFWGMARLGELVPMRLTKIIRLKDVGLSEDKVSMRIALKEAKTSKPGEIQYLYLRKHDSLLDPVGAVLRLLQKHVDDGMDENGALFSYNDNGTLGTLLRKNGVMGRLRSSWVKDGYGGLTGHSFRVGGASFLWNEKVPLEAIIERGRWKSKSYELYLREFDQKEIDENRNWLRQVELK